MTVSDPPLPHPGLTHRRPTVADAPLIWPLVVACDELAVGRSTTTVAELAADLAAPGVDLDRGGRLVLDAAGAAAGWLWTEDDATAGRVFLDPYATDPALLGWLLDRGLEYASAASAASGRPREVAAGSYAEDAAYGTVLTAAGFVEARRFWRMVLPLTPAGAPPEPVLPADAVVRRIDPAQDVAARRAAHAVHMGSFADHWDHHDRPLEEWWVRATASAGYDPTQWWLAEVGGRPAGVLVGDDTYAELDRGFVRILGVLREFRGRGLAQALLRTAFAEAARRGRSSVALGVDATSPTGATRLYESVGMTVEEETVAWQLRSGPGGTPRGAGPATGGGSSATG